MVLTWKHAEVSNKRGTLSHVSVWVTTGLVMEITSLLRGVCDSHWVECRRSLCLLVQLGVNQRSHPNRMLIIKRRGKCHTCRSLMHSSWYFLFPTVSTAPAPKPVSWVFIYFILFFIQIKWCEDKIHLESSQNINYFLYSLSKDGQDVKE